MILHKIATKDVSSKFITMNCAVLPPILWLICVAIQCKQHRDNHRTACNTAQFIVRANLTPGKNTHKNPG